MSVDSSPGDTAAPTAAPAAARPKSRAARRAMESVIRAGLVGCSSFSILTTIAIISVLAFEAIEFFTYPAYNPVLQSYHERPFIERGAALEPTATAIGSDDLRPFTASLERSGDDFRLVVETPLPPDLSLTRLSTLVTNRDGDGTWWAESVRPGDQVRMIPTVTDLRDADLLAADEQGLDRLPGFESAAVGAQFLEFEVVSVAPDHLLVRPSGPLAEIVAERDGEPAALELALAQPHRMEIWRESVTVAGFLTGTRWAPLLGEVRHFGVLPLVCGTLLVTLVAMLVAIPFGLITAIYLSEYAPNRLRGVLKPILEVLAGVPTVVYGFFALTIITPSLQWLTDPLVPADPGPNAWSGIGAYNALGAGIAVGIMCLPIVCSISEDALRAVPRALREGAYGVGGTKFDVSTKVVVPAALSGIVAASLLAIARAVGETMIVALAAGGLARLTLDPTDEVQTMTAYMVQIFLGDVSSFGVEYFSSYAVAATLFAITFLLTVIGHVIRVRFREEYD